MCLHRSVTLVLFALLNGQKPTSNVGGRCSKPFCTTGKSKTTLESDMELNAKQVGEAFRTVMLEENHNFLEDDLVLLANAFVRFAEPLIRADELEKCVEITRGLNTLVGQRLKQVRYYELNEA